MPFGAWAPYLSIIPARQFNREKLSFGALGGWIDVRWSMLTERGTSRNLRLASSKLMFVSNRCRIVSFRLHYSSYSEPCRSSALLGWQVYMQNCPICLQPTSSADSCITIHHEVTFCSSWCDQTMTSGCELSSWAAYSLVERAKQITTEW